MTIDHNQPAQAPKYNTPPQAHPEQVDGPFGPTPAHPGYKPHRLDTIDPNKNRRRAPWVIGGAAIASLAIAAGTYLSAKSDIDAIDKLTDDIVAGASEVPGTDYSNEALSPSQSREKEVGYGESVLADMRKESIADLQKLGFSANPEYSENASDQGLADGVFVDLYSAWKIGAESKAEGDRVLASIIDPETDDYDRTAAMIGTGGAPILSKVIRVAQSTENLSRENYTGANRAVIVPSNGNSMRILTSFYSDEPNTKSAGILNQVAYQRVGAITPDGKQTQKWVVKQMIAPEDKGMFVNDLRDFYSNVK